MEINIPAFKLVKGKEEIKNFDSYADLYMYCRKENTSLLGTILGNAAIIIYFGEVPLKYDIETHTLYALTYKEIKG